MLQQFLMLPKRFIHHFRTIHIVSDNNNAIYWIVKKQQTKDNTYITILNRIYKIAKRINEYYNIIIFFQTCKRETNHAIIIADRLAKMATKIMNNKAPINICPISKKIAKKLMNKRLYKASKINVINNIKKNHLISNNIYKWRYYISRNFDPMKELLLKQFQTSILIKLRSSHIELNNTKHLLKHHSYYKLQCQINNGHLQYIKCTLNCCKYNNSGKCDNCDSIEDVNHFLLNCNKYDKIRKKLMLMITPIYEYHHVNINLKTILFPPKNMKWCHRKMILANVCNYVLLTNRLRLKIYPSLDYD